MTDFGIHIGIHKTGSTTLQGYLAQNRAKLLELGIELPLFGQRKPTAKMHAGLGPFFREDLGADEIRPILETPPEIGYRLISSESLYLCFNNQEVAHIARFFPSSTTILCYVREPSSHIISFYKQHVKSKAESQSLAQFIDRFTIQLRETENAYYRYQKNLDIWRQYFPDVRVFRYERMTASALVMRFFNDLGLSVPYLDTKGVLEDRNPALPDEKCALLLRINRMKLGEIIDKATHEKWVKAILSGQMTQDLSGELIRQLVDLRPFLDAFALENPAFDFTEKMAESDFPIDVRLSDGQVREILERSSDCAVL